MKLVRNILYYLSPLTCWIIFCTLGFYIGRRNFSGDTTDWLYQVGHLFLPSFFIGGILVIVIRLITTNWRSIWAVELAIIALAWACYKFLFYF